MQWERVRCSDSNFEIFVEFLIRWRERVGFVLAVAIKRERWAGNHLTSDLGSVRWSARERYAWRATTSQSSWHITFKNGWPNDDELKEQLPLFYLLQQLNDVRRCRRRRPWPRGRCPTRARTRVRIPSTLHRSCSIYVFITSNFFFVVVKVHYFAIRLAQGQEDIKMLGEFIHVFVFLFW